MKKCIVNYISRNAWYPIGQARLAESLKYFKFDGDILFFNDSLEGCPSHHIVPYGFKPYCLNIAKNKGYDIALWVDSSFWARQSLDSLFKLIETNKICVQKSDYPVGQWSSDLMLHRMNTSREKAFSIPMFSGGFIGLNFKSDLALEFLSQWLNYSKDGVSFQGAWSNEKNQVSVDSRVRGHRHDMACGSIIANTLNIPLFDNNTFFSYYGWYVKYKEEYQLQNKIYFMCEGGTRSFGNGLI